MKIDTCTISTILAYSATVYIIASIYYLLVSRHFGTPFSDALQNYPELLAIKNSSASKRRNAFLQGIIGSILLMILWKPFNKCIIK